MSGFENIKPSYDEWMYWSQVVIDRLTTIVHVYSQPPHPEVFLREKERQEKLSKTVGIMKQIHTLTDDYELSIPKSALDASQREDGLVVALQPMLSEVLNCFPEWSADMQKLLKSPWMNQCNGKLATILFRGPDGREEEGIGSGMVENGRLPAKIADMLDREMAGGDRAPRIEKPRMAESRMCREDIARLWAKQNAAFLRTAGRMD